MLDEVNSRVRRGELKLYRGLLNSLIQMRLTDEDREIIAGLDPDAKARFVSRVRRWLSGDPKFTRFPRVGRKVLPAVKLLGNPSDAGM